MRALLLVFLSLTAEAQTWRARGVNGGGFFGPAQGGRAAVSGRVRQPQGSSGALFEFAPASGAGLPAAQTLCSAAAQYFAGKDVSWCTNGDGTAASGTTLSVATEQGTVTETTQQVCPNGPDCAAVPVLRPTTTASGYAELANVNRNASVTTGSFTACGHFVFEPSASFQVVSALTGSVALPGKYFLSVPGGAVFAQYNLPTVACGGGGVNLNGTITLEAGAPYVTCVSWSASDGIFRTYLNGVADTTAGPYATICGGDTNSRFSVGGHWNGAALASSPVLGGVFGAFYVDTTTGNGGQLSAAQILALSNAVLARGPAGAKGEALTFARASARACDSSTGLGTVVPSGVPCVSHDGARVWRQNTIISARSNELDNVYWTATATVTANQARSFDGTLSADQLSDASGAAQQGVSVAIASTSATLHTFQCFLSAGTASSYSIGFTGTGDATGDVTVNGTGLTSAGQWVSATSPAAYLGTLTAVTPFVRVGDTVGVTGTIFASYCVHSTSSPRRLPAARTVAAGVTVPRDDWRVAFATPPTGATAANGFCIASTSTCANTTNGRIVATYATAGGTPLVAAEVYSTGTANASWSIGATNYNSGFAVDAVQRRWLGRFGASGAAMTVCRDGTCGSGGARGGDAAGNTSATLYLGAYLSGGFECDGTISRFQFDPDPTRCTP